ncbi:fluoride efflux transporter CrcB [Francisella sp. Scap27]|uniref:fluoride efflux transporter CrcB n=1 Tax=Francisella sp. Scap27 TaxID=2589986 RepID=UPI0015BBF552|nr:fluoride efflux transporter CrcB [Francisella sp. Scap27]QLE79018.1 fluoride efflux transporter CrcB [Francisella sp. Scap27]
MSLMILLVGIGGGLGAISRFLVMQATSSFSSEIPFGVFLCNIIGSLTIGLIAAFLIKTNLFNEEISAYTRSLVVTGFLGGFTTFSSFSLDVLNLLQRGEVFIALGYIIASVLVSILAVVLGFYLVMGVYK